MKSLNTRQKRKPPKAEAPLMARTLHGHVARRMVRDAAPHEDVRTARFARAVIRGWQNDGLLANDPRP